MFSQARVAEIRFSTGSLGDSASAKDAISATGHLRRETMAFAIATHTLAAAIWVGGMFFAYMALRPSAGPLEAPVRLQLWERVFSRFFP
jgi:putative copper export protein